MSADGHQPASHGPEPREFSHPALWTIGLVAIIGALGWVFFHQIAAGKEKAKGEPAYALPKKASGPDHQALIADRSPAVLDRGEVLYGKNCASCHGPNGDGNPANITPVPRNFRTEALKNPLGSGPYAWYEVLSKGYGSGMPGFRNLPPEDRYAVAHFIRERWVKPNPAIYVENDAPEVAKQIPAKGGAAGEVAVDLDKVAPPAAILPAMAQSADKGVAEQVAVAAWLQRARTAGPGLAGLAAAGELVERQPGTGARWLALARRGDAAALAAALAAGDGGLPAAPALATLGREDLQHLATRLVAAASGTAP